MRLTFASIVASFFVALSACDGAHDGIGRAPDEYTGCAIDENWPTFDDNQSTAVVADDSAPVVTEPAAGTITFSTKPIFAWEQSRTALGEPFGDVPHEGPGCDACCPQWNTGAIVTLHLPAISGNLYDLQFSVDGAVDHRVLTTLQRWTPTDAKWATWRGKTVSLTLYRMTVLTNDLRPGTGGPFVDTEPFVFTVNP